ncbi:hypothetical protein KCP69_03800 [Salmonella enterica subsp. enterica]|nr:hypothetical protein KCP69_03800 [Salmonella enterica subsp. enterica]
MVRHDPRFIFTCRRIRCQSTAAGCEYAHQFARQRSFSRHYFAGAGILPGQAFPAIVTMILLSPAHGKTSVFWRAAAKMTAAVLPTPQMPRAKWVFKFKVSAQ